MWNYRLLSHVKCFCDVKVEHDYEDAEILQNSAESENYQKYIYNWMASPKPWPFLYFPFNIIDFFLWSYISWSNRNAFKNRVFSYQLIFFIFVGYYLFDMHPTCSCFSLLKIEYEFV